MKIMWHICWLILKMQIIVVNIFLVLLYLRSKGKQYMREKYSLSGKQEREFLLFIKVK